MKRSLQLSTFIGKTLFREKVIFFLIISMPILLVFAGAASAPSGTLSFQLDGNLLSPAPNAKEVSVTLYSLTAVVLVSSIVSFFLGFNIKNLIPRLKQVKYSSLDISLAFVFVMVITNILMTVSIGLFSFIWVTPSNYTGYFMGIFLSSILFSIIGLIIAEIVDTSTLGIYLVLTLAIMDTGFMENPVYSRRYDSNFITIMPSHESLQMVLRSTFDTSVNWYSNLWFIILYGIGLIMIYLLIIKIDVRSKLK